MKTKTLLLMTKNKKNSLNLFLYAILNEVYLLYLLYLLYLI
jgi:hypothetical protein